MKILRNGFLALILLSLSIVIVSCEGDAENPADTFSMLTWRSPDTATTMTINFKLNDVPSAATVFYDTISHEGVLSSYQFKKPAQEQRVKNLESFHFYQVELTELQPATTYYYVMADEAGNVSLERKFRTLPNDKRKISFVTGGDMGTSGAFIPLLKLAGEQSPDFALIGGDITYANGKVENWKKWIEWLQGWRDNVVTPDGYDVPLVAAIGNHEIRGGALTKIAPFYNDILRQHKKSYFIRNFGENMRLFVLDTGHISPHFGKQRRWLKNELKKAEKEDVPYKFAIYHIPMYPSHRKYSGIQSKIGRIFWKPLFEKYNLHTAFENHDHVLKRTHILKKGKVSKDGKGVLYLGDGCFGRKRREAHPDRWYLAKAIGVEHFWYGEIDSEGVSYKAIDLNGEVRDTYRRLKQ